MVSHPIGTLFSALNKSDLSGGRCDRVRPLGQKYRLRRISWKRGDDLVTRTASSATPIGRSPRGRGRLPPPRVGPLLPPPVDRLLPPGIGRLLAVPECPVVGVTWGGTAVLIRPGGHAAWVEAMSEDALREAIDRWCPASFNE
jgi:hypothetical protein